MKIYLVSHEDERYFATKKEAMEAARLDSMDTSDWEVHVEACTIARFNTAAERAVHLLNGREWCDDQQTVAVFCHGKRIRTRRVP